MVMPLDYDSITLLYDTSGDVIVANKGTYTHITDEIILALREDVDYLGELRSMTGSNWTSNNFDWEKGTTIALPQINNKTQHWLSYITDLRTACEELYTDASLGSPTWTISTANLKPLYEHGETATTSSSVLTQSGADFTQVTNGTDYVYITSGTGVTPGFYLVNSHTTTTLTLNTDPGDSATGDIVFTVSLAGNAATYADVRKKSLYTDVRTALIAVGNATFIYVDSANGNDTTGDGTKGNPYKTWDKAATVCNATPTNIYFEAGTYSFTTTALTANNVLVQGSALGDVTFKAERYDPGPIYMFNGATGITVENIKFLTSFLETPDTHNRHFLDCTNLTINECIFTYKGTSQSWCSWIYNANGTTLNHVTYMGHDKANDGLYLRNVTGTVTLNDVIFYDFDNSIELASCTGTINENNCGFYLYNAQHEVTGVGTPTVNQTDVLTSDPEISSVDSAYLSDSSPYIDQATDNFDIGGYKNGPYNQFETVSETITCTEPSVIDRHAETILEPMPVNDQLQEINMNVSIDMFLGGIFESSTGGVITYLDKTDSFLTNITSAVNTDFTYNGASLDVSFDNAGGDNCKVYIAVDDGTSQQYDKAWWWVLNADYSAASTTDEYAIDIWNECVTNDEFGKLWSFSTVTADGVNDQQADISINVRVHNTVTDQWSELVTASKTYNFNDFNKTMYYCADNPRAVDSEYANHANYYAQPYHTGTTKYTRPDGVDWVDDDRLYAYSPSLKIMALLQETSFATGAGAPSSNVYDEWKDRQIGGSLPLAYNVVRSAMCIFSGVFVNFGNWNNASNHCFDNSTPTVLQQARDNGVATLLDPLLGDDSTDIHYTRLSGYEGTDCTVHSSQNSNIIRFPNGDNIAWGAFSKRHKPLLDADIFFLEDENPHVSCQPDENYYLWVKEPTPVTPGGYTAWWQSFQEAWVNTASGTGSYSYGELAFKKRHNADTGTLTTLW
jgi:hypothetical protein